jgi:uncharacterized protein YjbJ (UPF0337 family)
MWQREAVVSRVALQMIDKFTVEEDNQTLTGQRHGPISTEGAMNESELQRDWKGVSSLLKWYWTKLTDRALERIDGRRDELAASLRRLYGYGAEEAKREIFSFEGSFQPE